MSPTTFRRQWTVGVIGAGEMATMLHLPVLLTEPDVSVAYVADVSRHAVERARRMHGCKPIVLGPGLDDLPDTDIVLLTIPVGARGDYYAQLAERPVAVYAEKPVATTVRDAMRLHEQFGDGRMACGFQRRFYANFALLERAVNERWFGPLRRIVVSEGARTTSTGFDTSFREDAALSGGGILMDLGCHSVDLVQRLTPNRELVLREHRLVFDAEIDREAELELSAAGPGSDVAIEVSLSWLRPLLRAVRLDFESCSLSTSTRPEGSVRITGQSPGTTAAGLSGADNLATTPFGAVRLAWRSYLQSLEAREPNPLSLRSCLPTIALIERTYRSARQESNCESAL